MTTSSVQGRPVVPRHLATGTCAVRSVLAHLLPSGSSVQCLNAKSSSL